MGARAPGRSAAVKAFMADEDLAMGAGAKAAAEPARTEARASFIIFKIDVIVNEYLMAVIAVFGIVRIMRVIGYIKLLEVDTCRALSYLTPRERFSSIGGRFIWI